MSDFKMAQMSSTQLNTVVDGAVATEVTFRFLSGGTTPPKSTPYNFQNFTNQQVLDADLATMGNWTSFSTSTPTAGYVGSLNASTIPLDNKYYIIRGEVEKVTIGETADTDARDNFVGGLLGDALYQCAAHTPPYDHSGPGICPFPLCQGAVLVAANRASDASEKLTAKWLNEQGIILGIKVDKVRPKVPVRFPPAN
jgi:hypothetical protein